MNVSNYKQHFSCSGDINPPDLREQALQTCCRNRRLHHWPRSPPAGVVQSWTDTPNLLLKTPRGERNLEQVRTDRL